MVRTMGYFLRLLTYGVLGTLVTVIVLMVVALLSALIVNGLSSVLA